MIDINITEKDMKIVKDILGRFVPEYDVYAFGSRIAKTCRKTSDLDIVIMTHKPLETLEMINLKSAFTESDLSFKVDIVDWSSIKENFRKIIDSSDKLKIQAK